MNLMCQDFEMLLKQKNAGAEDGNEIWKKTFFCRRKRGEGGAVTRGWSMRFFIAI